MTIIIWILALTGLAFWFCVITVAMLWGLMVWARKNGLEYYESEWGEE